MAILNDYDVARNLRLVPHPFTDTLFREALTRIDGERRDGTDFSFAVTRAMDGALIGLCAVRISTVRHSPSITTTRGRLHSWRHKTISNSIALTTPTSSRL